MESKVNWMPIETAPKDQIIMLYSEDEGKHYMWTGQLDKDKSTEMPSPYWPWNPFVALTQSSQSRKTPPCLWAEVPWPKEETDGK